jgi:hypothetical protein
MDDRRHDPRIAYTTTAVVLARHNAGVEVTLDSVSVGGARFRGSVTLALGERVHILLEVGGPLEVEAEVVRVERYDLVTDRFAVRFIELDEDARARIRALVQQVLDALD